MTTRPAILIARSVFPEIVAKLRETADQLDCSVNELLQSMVRFAQCNRNWKQVGLYGRREGVLQ